MSRLKVQVTREVFDEVLDYLGETLRGLIRTRMTGRSRQRRWPRR